jgi:hypothetical protein
VAETPSFIIAFPAALLAFAALASCGGGGDTAADGEATTETDTPVVPGMLFADNFKGVCSGASVSAATAYDPAAKAHKALYFTTYEDDYTDRSSSLPGDWTIQWSADSNALAGIDVVVCSKRTAAQEVKVCDGYENDGKPTQNKVRWHTATYELTVREATTGKVLATTTAEATDTDCPMFASFESDSDTVDDYDELSDATVTDFLRPHITS